MKVSKALATQLTAPRRPIVMDMDIHGTCMHSSGMLEATKCS